MTPRVNANDATRRSLNWKGIEKLVKWCVQKKARLMRDRALFDFLTQVVAAADSSLVAPT